MSSRAIGVNYWRRTKYNGPLPTLPVNPLLEAERKRIQAAKEAAEESKDKKLLARVKQQ